MLTRLTSLFGSGLPKSLNAFTAAPTSETLQKLLGSLRSEIGLSKPSWDQVSAAIHRIWHETAHGAAFSVDAQVAQQANAILKELPETRLVPLQDPEFVWFLAMNPPCWLLDDNVQRLQRNAWRHLQSMPGRHAVTLALRLRRSKPDLARSLRVEVELAERLRQYVVDGLAPPPDRATADDLTDAVARALVDAQGLALESPSAWGLALLLEADALDHIGRHLRPAFVTLCEETLGSTQSVAAFLQLPWHERLESHRVEVEEWLARVARHALSQPGVLAQDRSCALRLLASREPLALLDFLPQALLSEADPVVYEGLTRAAEVAGIPTLADTPNTVTRFVRPAHATDRHFELARYFFANGMNSDVACLARYTHVLAVLAGPSDQSDLRDTLVGALQRQCADPLAWDDLTLASAEALASAAGTMAQSYSHLLESCGPDSVEPILQRESGRFAPGSTWKLKLLAQRWQPTDGSAELEEALVAFWWNEGANDAPWWPLSERAAARPRVRLVQAALTLRRQALLEAETHLLACRAERPELPGRSPLRWSHLWRELGRATEEMVGVSLSAGIAGLASRLRLAQKQYAEAWHAGLTGLRVATDAERPACLQSCQQLLGQIPITAAHVMNESAATILFELPVWGRNLLQELAQRLVAAAGDEPSARADAVDRLLAHLNKQEAWSVGSPLWLLWTQPPRLRNDPTETLRRLRVVQGRNAMPLSQLVAVVEALPVEYMHTQADIFWTVELYVSEQRHDAALHSFDRLTDTTLRQKAVALFTKSTTQLVPPLAWEYMKRTVDAALGVEDVVLLKKTLRELLAFPDHPLRGETANRVHQVLIALADQAQVKASAAGIDWLMQTGNARHALGVMKHLIERRLGWQEPLQSHFEPVVAAANLIYAERCELHYQLADYVEATNLADAVALHEKYLRRETHPHAERQALLERLTRLAATQHGEKNRRLLLLAAELALDLIPGLAVNLLDGTVALGEVAGAVELLQKLAFHPEGDQGCEVLIRLVRWEHQLGRQPLASLVRLLQCVESLNGDAVETRIADWRARVEAMLREMKLPTNDLEVAQAHVWAGDLGQPALDEWSPDQALAAENLLGSIAKQAAGWQKRLNWLSGRILPRAGRLHASLYLPLLEALVCANQRGVAEKLVDVMWERFRENADVIGANTMRVVLTTFFQSSARTSTETSRKLQLGLIEFRLVEGDFAEAALAARRYLEANDNPREPLLKLLACQTVFVPPSHGRDQVWEIILELASSTPAESSIPWKEWGLTAMQLLAQPGPRTEQQCRLGLAVRDRLNQDHGAAVEADLALGIIAFHAGDFQLAGQCWATLLSRPDAWLNAPPLDPLSAFQLARPSSPGDAENVVLALVARLDADWRGPNAGADDARRAELQEMVYRLAFRCTTPRHDLASRAILEMNALGETFSAQVAALLRHFKANVPEGRQRNQMVLLQAQRCLRSGNTDQAIQEFRTLIPNWQADAENAQSVATLLLQDTGVLHDDGLLLVLFDVELTLRRFAEARPLVALLAARAGLHGELEPRLIFLAEQDSSSWPLLRRVAAHRPKFADDVLSRLLHAASQGAPVHPEEFILWIAESPQRADLRCQACGYPLNDALLAGNLAQALLLGADDPKSMERLETLAAHDGDAACLLGQVWLSWSQTPRDDQAALRGRVSELWDRTLCLPALQRGPGWGLFARAAAFWEQDRQYDRAHACKLEEARLKATDRTLLPEVVRLFRMARVQDLERIGPPANPDQALQAARLHRLLGQALQGILLLQRFLPTTQGEQKGHLLLQLGQLYTGTMRYDLSAACHAEAESLLACPKARIDNWFGHGVALAYLQRRDESRHFFERVLVHQADHLAAQAELAKLDLPLTLLHLHQLAELTSLAWLYGRNKNS